MNKKLHSYILRPSNCEKYLCSLYYTGMSEVEHYLLQIFKFVLVLYEFKKK